ncbi:MAG: thiol protease/hemagglutinin PrtT [Bacteroidales bacterium]|nr:thiol protease/hemagglutinin PrtT [Bacteroidales bacterium]
MEGSFAKSVDEMTACKVAKHFYAMNSKRSLETLTPVLVYTSDRLRGEKNSEPCFYVFNFENEGFVIVAGDDRAQPVLAFSTEGNFVSENIPEHIRFFLNGYVDEIHYVIDNQQEKDENVRKQWNRLLANVAPATKEVAGVVGPLLGDNKWNQTKFYNNLCPVDSTGNAAYGGHVAVGCGALVMGQVMRYWHFPDTGVGSHSYTSNYGILSANFGSTAYRYENMPDQLITTYHPDSCVEAIATLLYHCGVSVNMYYGPNASVSNSNNIVAALTNYFKYPNTVQYVERGTISTTSWLTHIKDELNEGAPFMYGGSGMYGGHVWICDGYREDDYLHFNWGWGGQQNGYYAITACSSYGFNNNHAVIVGIRGPQLPNEIAEGSQHEIKIYPNPTYGSVHITDDLQEAKQIQVFDMFGKMILQQEVNERQVTLDLSKFESGTYIVRILTSDGWLTSKILKN